MEAKFILSCESTVDLPYAYVSSRNIPVLFYSYSVDGQEYPDDMGRDPESLPRFYQFLADGKIPSTSQIMSSSMRNTSRSCFKKATCCTSLLVPA